MSAEIEKRYALLCSTVSNANDRLDEGEYKRAEQILRIALLKSEEIYCKSDVKLENS